MIQIAPITWVPKQNLSQSTQEAEAERQPPPPVKKVVRVMKADLTTGNAHKRNHSINQIESKRPWGIAQAKNSLQTSQENSIKKMLIFGAFEKIGIFRALSFTQESLFLALKWSKTNVKC